MKITYFLLTLLVLGALTYQAQAWLCKGHQLVAQIAYAELESIYNDKLAQINDILDLLKNMTNEKVRPFVEGACWADFIKTWFKAYDDWHYKDVPIYRGIGKNVTVNSYNSEWALHELEYTLLQHYKTNNSKLMKSLTLRLYIHIVGDMHQPLHSAALYSDRFPEGDLGGNLFPITYKDYPQLHRLWDAGCDQYRDDTGPSVPLDSEGLKYYILEAQALTAQFPRQYFKQELKFKDYDSWVEETYKKAKKYAYKDLEVGARISEEYIEEGKEVSKKQITLAGYRLADKLSEIFRGNNDI